MYYYKYIIFFYKYQLWIIRVIQNKHLIDLVLCCQQFNN